MSESTLKWGMVCLFLFLFGVIAFDDYFSSWRAVEIARLRCAPSAAPSGSAP